MPYPKKLLNDYEEVAVDLHPHWWYFSTPLATLVGAIVLGIVTLFITDGGSTTRTVLGWISLIAIVASVIWIVWRYMKWSTTNFVITSDRLIFRSGVVAKSGIEIPLERVNSVHFRQGLFERMIGAGDLLIESGAEDGRQRFTDIRRPDRVQNEIHVQMEANDRRSRQPLPGQGGANTDVASQLLNLEGMLERGTLSPEEFQAHKAKLLGQ